MIDERYIRYTFDIFKPDGKLVEIRTMGGKNTSSGYFTDVETVLKYIQKYDGQNIFFVFNSIKDACYSRQQRDKIVDYAKTTTSDTDITKRDWFFIDIDPVRISDVSATDAEKKYAYDKALSVYEFMDKFGFSKPVVCDSGNGYHLFYKTSLPNTDEINDLFKRCLEVLKNYFTDNSVKIDTSINNPARISKLYGTMACKGSNTPERPHRLSRILKVPEKIKENMIEIFQSLASNLPEPEKPSIKNNYNPEKFDLNDFIRRHGIAVRSQTNDNGSVKYVLEQCVFDSNHKGKDAAIFQMANGAIGYKCFHNSCSHYKWQDVRRKFEPDAYDKKFEPAINRKVKNLSKTNSVTHAGEEKFLTVVDIKTPDRKYIISMPSGFDELDKKIIGFNKGETTLWSGKNGAAKSTILNQIALNSIENGFNGVIFSGELQPHKLKNWIYLQAAGRQFTQENEEYEGLYYVTKYISRKIDLWLKDKLYIYNNNYGMNFESILNDFKDIVISKKLDWVIFDNLMALDLEEDNYNINRMQKKFIIEITNFAKLANIHCHIVAHPRKNVGFLRKDDISGSSDLSNAVENVIICHRNNTDYKKAVADYFPKEMLPLLTSKSNYIEVCKNRDMGVMDLLVGLHYELESKRILNNEWENKVFSWQEIEKQSTIESMIKPNLSFDSDPFSNTEINKQVPF